MRGRRVTPPTARNLRSQRGAQIIEATCTSVIVALMTCCMFDTINAQGRLVTEGKNQIFATNFAQSTIEAARSLPYSVLESQVGKHPLDISANTTTPFYREHATATQQVDVVNPNMVRITVDVTWGERGRKRSLRLSSLVSRWGTHG